MTLNESYVLHGQDSASQLYYKIHEILGNGGASLLHKSSPIVRSNVRYSGTLKTHLKGLISHRNQLSEISTNTDSPHKLQFSLEYWDNASKQWFVLVANYQDEGPFRCEPFEKGVLASRALRFVKERYLAIYEGS
jgi:hypothetical protein